MRIITRTWLLVCLVALTLSAYAQNTKRPADLMAGDDAPGLKVAKWVKGNPVNSLDKGNIYVVEFWATWCGPCRVSIPHLTELQKKFAGKATFIGVSSFENNWSGVEPFVKDMGDKMAYNVAMDQIDKPEDREGYMAKNWMEAAKQPGIPTAFVVGKEGKIEWIGHPMELEQPLSKVVDGTWNRSAFISEYSDRMAKQAAEEAAAANNPLTKLRAAYSAAVRAKKWDDALKACDEMDKAGGAGTAAMARYNVYVRSGNTTKASAYGRQLVEGVYKDNVQALNSLAWMHADPKSKIANRDSSLAVFAAERAVKVSERKDSAILDTLAWAYFESGNKTKAIATEKEALSKASTEEKAGYEASLKQMQE